MRSAGLVSGHQKKSESGYIGLAVSNPLFAPLSWHLAEVEVLEGPEFNGEQRIGRLGWRLSDVCVASGRPNAMIMVLIMANCTLGFHLGRIESVPFLYKRPAPLSATVVCLSDNG